MNAFSPVKDGTVSISADATSKSVTLTKIGVPHYEVYNDGPDTVFVYFSISGETITAATNYPIAAGESRMIGVSPIATTAYARCLATKTSTVYFIPGAAD